MAIGKHSKKKIPIALITLLCVAGIFIAGFIVLVSVMTSGVPITIIADYHDESCSGVIQLPTVTDLDDDYIIHNSNLVLDTIATLNISSSGACSTLFVPIATESGNTTLMGRNLDYDVSDSPAWVFYTDAPGRYRSFNMGYLGHDINAMGLPVIPSMEEIEKSGEIPRYLLMLLPYVVTDAINDQGLIVEINVRKAHPGLICNGTNTSSDVRICNALLVRYLVDHCANIEEALALVKTLNIYAPHSNAINVNFALGMMDATGRHGILEFVQNEIIWHENQVGQTNFWIDENASAISDLGGGLGRWQVLQTAYPSVIDAETMFSALIDAYYGQIYTKTSWESTFDVTYDLYDFTETMTKMLKEVDKEYAAGNITMDLNERETVGKILTELPDNSLEYWTRSELANPDIRTNITRCYDFITQIYNQLPLSFMIENKQLSSSVFSYVTSSTEPVLYVKFFQHDEIYPFGFPNA